MKRLYIIFLLLFIAGLANAQTTLKERMDEVATRFGMNFIYDPSLPVSDTYTGSGRNDLSLEESLEDMFSGRNIRWTIRKKYISLKAVSKKSFTIGGHVVDAVSSETLIGAGVFTGSIGTIANEFGFYSITLPEGEYELTASFIGYERVTKKVVVDRDKTVNFDLSINSELVSAKIRGKVEAGVHATRPGSLEIPQNMIGSTPVLGGEPDVLKTLQAIPGTQSGFDGFSGICVRGGGDDENLLLMDGVPVYNASHMFGLFSVFTPEAVKRVNFYKGAFPARYGGRVSSIVDVRTNDGDMHKMHGTVSVGLLSDRFHLEGPIAEGKTSFSVSGRVLHTFLFSPILKHLDVEQNYYYYDFNAKVNHKISDNDRVYVGLYRGRDYFRGEEDDSDPYYTSESDNKQDWGNIIASIRWNHVFSDNIFSNTTIFHNRYKGRIYTRDMHKDNKRPEDIFTDEYNRSTGINDTGFMYDIDWNPSPSHSVRTGVSYTFHNYRPVVHLRHQESIRGSYDASRQKYVLDGHELSCYFEDDMMAGEKVRLNAGVNLVLFNTQGKTYFSPQPRVSFRYDLKENLFLKTSYSRMAQYIHKLSTCIIDLPTDQWVPITNRIKPLTSDLYSLGITCIREGGWEMTAETYFKESHSVLDYKDSVSPYSGQYSWDQNIAMGYGRSYGAELTVSKTEGKLTGWIGYTWSKSERKFADGSVNGGKWFPYKYDRRHVVNLNASYKFNEKVSVNALWFIASGAALTVPSYPVEVVGYDGVSHYSSHVSERGSYRLPMSHRLDLGISLSKRKKHGIRTWNFGLYNVYAHKNIMGIDPEVDADFNYSGPNVEGGRKVRRKVKSFAILLCIPSFSYTYKF